MTIKEAHCKDTVHTPTRTLVRGLSIPGPPYSSGSEKFNPIGLYFVPRTKYSSPSPILDPSRGSKAPAQKSKTTPKEPSKIIAIPVKF